MRRFSYNGKGRKDKGELSLYIERIGARTVKICLPQRDLLQLDTSFEKLMRADTEAVKILRDILCDAADALGLDMRGCRILAEVYREKDGCIILFTRLRRKLRLRHRLKSVVVRFDKPQALFALCSHCGDTLRFSAYSTLYYYSGCYYLAAKLPMRNMESVRLLLCEFGDGDCIQDSRFYAEHGKEIAKGEALKRLCLALA